jgi:hypothetical protein
MGFYKQLNFTYFFTFMKIFLHLNYKVNKGQDGRKKYNKKIEKLTYAYQPIVNMQTVSNLKIRN